MVRTLSLNLGTLEDFLKEISHKPRMEEVSVSFLESRMKQNVPRGGKQFQDLKESKIGNLANPKGDKEKLQALILSRNM